MMDVPLNSETFVMFAMKHYDNPQCVGIEEFNDDLNRTKYLKRLFKKYELSGVLKERLILNHLIVIYNVFGPTPATRLLFFKLDGYYDLLKPFLMLMNQMPEIVYGIGPENKDIKSVDLSMDSSIIKSLRKI